MRIVYLILAGLLIAVRPAYAYPEYPSFEQTQFADGTGMFRWWESCWWRVLDPYVYLRCEPNGDMFIVYPDGTVSEATDSEIERLFSTSGGVVNFNAPGTSGSRLGVSRFFPGRTSAAPGDGIRLSDFYGSTFTRPGVSQGAGSDTGVFRFSGTDGAFRSEGTGAGANNTFRFSNGSDDGVQRIFGDEVPTSDGAGSTGAFSGGDGFFSENNLRTRMSDAFYEPVGLVGCDSIDDYRDEGGIFGPIPCTSYPGVFGPVPRY